MSVYRINKTRLAELVDRTIKYVVEADLKDVTSIGTYAFRDCTSLTSIIIPNSVMSIGTYAFRDCTSLTSIIIPNSVTSIGASAFYGCTSLTSIIIPDSVTSIGASAFNNCTNLSNVIMKSTTPPIIGSSTFNNSGITATTGSIKVPVGSLESYKTASNWSVYADIITEE